MEESRTDVIHVLSVTEFSERGPQTPSRCAICLHGVTSEITRYSRPKMTAKYVFTTRFGFLGVCLVPRSGKLAVKHT